MDFLIVTGLSGAGKSRAVDALEDIGFYCVDNMPPQLISKVAEICLAGNSQINRIAIVTDLRGGDMFYGLFEQLDELKDKGLEYKLLFLDASNQELVRRYKETRRRHPLADLVKGGLEEAIRNERILLKPARERADYIIDTTHLSANELKQRMNNIFLDNIRNSMLVNVMSFGFKYGVPAEADLVFDVRCLPNPFYVDDLKPKTGLDEEVRNYVMDSEDSRKLLEKLKDLISFLIPLYQKEGKTQLMIGVGCTGGKHRSVTFAELLYQYLSDQNHNVRVLHRDIAK
ncbi:MAG TPA: RNase adapter RapZ [Candidatus Merdivicinus excrementipullorum]|uniref:RNase adapter RapZ n=1 Tax=Candidatus Merdivicinus excrementipullorum TaxID=2840867 RepID=A0A9D1FP39_9FIRM|nr:RNase adapter RapZ [Candidatus Merdivicinus excrementipullorum]